MQLNAKNITLSTRKFLQKLLKFHYVISISLLVAGVAFTIYYINAILNQTPPLDPNQPTGFNDKFDSATIEKIDKLKYSDETPTLSQPAGRTNPFTE